MCKINELEFMAKVRVKSSVYEKEWFISMSLFLSQLQIITCIFHFKNAQL